MLIFSIETLRLIIYEPWISILLLGNSYYRNCTKLNLLMPYKLRVQTTMEVKIY